jgi:hypothetical protein
MISTPMLWADGGETPSAGMLDRRRPAGSRGETGSGSLLS